MPVYNNERFLREAVDSLINQSFTDWILFFSDDASKDKTRQICEEYAAKDPRIIYYHQEKNLGLFPNYKFTLDQARGEYFMWAAGDDVWDKDFLKICVSYLEDDPALGMSVPCNTTIDSFGRTLLTAPWMTKWTGRPGIRQVSKYIMEAESYGKCNLMYGLFRLEALRKIWQAYPQRNVWGQDYMFSLAVVARYGVKVDHRSLFKKRLGGYSSPQLNLENSGQSLQNVEGMIGKNQMFPFGRFGAYLSGHLEALRGTAYRPLAYLLFLRLPRALMIHVKERSAISFLKRKFSKK